MDFVDPASSPPARRSHGARAPGTIHAYDLGLVGYRDALSLQRDLVAAKQDGGVSEDFLLLLEHPPVITRGRAARGSNLLVSEEVLSAHGIEHVEVERGGDLTYHGPGQLVAYPILDLGHYRRDLHWYLRRLEETIFRTLGRFGIPAFRVDGYTGVWVGESCQKRGTSTDPRSDDALPAASAAPLIAARRVRKIASIGIHASRWITRHGLALNRTNEALDGFRWIVPCGIEGVGITSIEAEGVTTSAGDVKLTLRAEIAEAFETRVECVDGLPAPFRARSST